MAGFFPDDILGAVPGASDSPAPSAVASKPSPLLSGLPGIKGTDVGLADPPRLIVPDMTGPTPANKDDTKNFKVPTGVPDSFDTTNPPGTATPHQMVAGPVTPELVIAAGFPKEEAEGWAQLANWITKGETKRDASAYMELYNGKPWQGGMLNHPYALGWPGDVGPDGRPTSAFGLFQDEYGTWKEISKNYLKGDTTISPINQIKGNLLLAADLYQKQTGRNVLADFQSGNIASVEQALHSTWPTLGKRGRDAYPGDAAFNQYIRQTREDIDHGEAGLQQLMQMARTSDPLSEEMKAHLHKAIERSDEMAEKYRTLSEHPPQAQTPMAAASAFAPLLIFLAAMGGFATRRPALGAINAMSGALQGLKEGNDQQFANNVDLWKSRTKMAHEAFQMQNESIRNIIDDIQLTETEKQHKLQDAFRFWQMDQDLKLARENNWKQIYERQDQREDKQLERQWMIARTEKTFADARKASEEFKRGGVNMTGNAKALYDTLYDQYTEEHGGAPDRKTQIELEQKAIQMSRTADLGLTPGQQQKNETIQKERDYFDYDKIPKSFDEDVTTAQTDQSKTLDNDQLAKRGYTPHQIALYKALIKPTLDTSKNAADAAILKRWQTAQTPPFQSRKAIIGESGAAQVTPTGPASDREAGTAYSKDQLDNIVLAIKEKDPSRREEAKARYLERGEALGLSEADFDAIWPEPGGTPTGPVNPHSASLSDMLVGAVTGGLGGAVPQRQPLGLEPQFRR